MLKIARRVVRLASLGFFVLSAIHYWRLTAGPTNDFQLCVVYLLLVICTEVVLLGEKEKPDAE